LENPNRPTRLTLIAFAIATFLGGNNAVAVRFTIRELPPFWGASLRFSGAAILLWLVVLAKRLPVPRGRHLLSVLGFGALNIGISYALLYWAIVELPAGLAMVILSLVPLFTFLFAIAHRQESFQWKVLAGCLLAAGGIAIISLDQIHNQASIISILAVVLSAACFAEASVIFKMIPRTHPITTNALAVTVGAVFLAGMSWLLHEAAIWPESSSTWLAVSYLVVFGSVGMFVLMLFVLERWKASAASFQVVLMPLVTALSAYWLIEEPLTFSMLTGGMLVLGGVIVGILPPRRSGQVNEVKALP
jgi:drug/metabolite transporter (DMT)-like permease